MEDEKLNEKLESTLADSDDLNTAELSEDVVASLSDSAVVEHDSNVAEVPEGTVASSESTTVDPNVSDVVSKDVACLTDSMADLNIINEILLDDAAKAPALEESSADDGNICWQTSEWKEKEKHVFILSSAGKPIYSRYGDEDDLVTLFGVMQALVSVMIDADDEIKSVHTCGTRFTFLRKGPILLVSVSRIASESESRAVLQLTYVYKQILSVITLSQLRRIFDQHNNFDLRRLLTGSERLINRLLEFTETQPAFFLGAIECLPLAANVRDPITQAIVSSCNKVKNLLFVLLIAENQLITFVRLKKYNLHPIDIHLIFNLVSSSTSLKTSESWIPICLPTFDPSGYLQAHVSYLSENCPACLLMLTVDREMFFTLSEIKLKILEKMKKNNLIDQLAEATTKPKIRTKEFNIAKLRHFIYKNKITSQFVFPLYDVPYNTEGLQKILLRLYDQVHQRVSNPVRPLKLLFQKLDTEVILVWDTKSCEVYLVLEPFVTKQDAINILNKLLKSMKKEDDRLFINNYATI